MSQPKIEFYKLRDFGAKMNATIEFLRENIGRLFLNLLFIAGPLALILSIFFKNLFSTFFNLGFNAGQSGDVSEFSSAFAVIGGSYFLMIIVIWLATSMIISVTYTYIRLYNEGVAKETSVGDVFRLALKKYGGILLLGILIGLSVVFGMFFFIIPGIYLAVTLSLAYPIYVFEDISPTDAFGRTFRLIRQKWWSTFGILIVTALLAYVVQLLFNLPLMVVYLMNIFTIVEESANNPGDPQAFMDMFSSWYMAVALAITMLGTYLSYCIPQIGLAYQYSNLVERSEGKGLMNEIEDFDKE